MPPSNLRPAVEALLFSSDQPLTLAMLSDALEAPTDQVAETLKALHDDYASRDAGVEVRQLAGGWQFVTRPDMGEWVARMLRGKRRMRLSRAALECMAIVAYKQPVTKSEIESIRGVDSSGVMATLLERNLITIRGRSTVVGRPLLYGSTAEFLNYFGLNDLAELPRPEELRALVAAREPEQLDLMEDGVAPGVSREPPVLQATSGDEGGAVVAQAGGQASAAPRERFSLAEADAALADAAHALDRAESVIAGDGEDGAAASGFVTSDDVAFADSNGDDEDEDDWDDDDDDDDDEDEFDDDLDDDDEADEDDEDDDEARERAELADPERRA